MNSKTNELTPTSTEDWALEAFNALQEAWQLASAVGGNMDTQTKQGVYKYAPIFCAKNRGIHAPSEKKDLVDYVIQNRLQDFQVDPAALSSYALNFLLGYLDGNLLLGLVSEREIEKIMVYIIDHHQLPE